MHITKCIVLLVLIVGTGFLIPVPTFTTALNNKIPKYKFEWQQAYMVYLTENWKDVYSIYVGDINDCGIPEIVVQINAFPGYATVIYYVDDSVKTLDLYYDSIWGHWGFLEETKQFIFLEFYGHTDGTFGNITNYVLYDWTEDGYVESYRIDRESGFYGFYWKDAVPEYGQAYINGEEVSNEEFEIALEAMKELSAKATGFPALKCTDENELFTLESSELMNYLEKNLLFRVKINRLKILSPRSSNP